MDSSSVDSFIRFTLVMGIGMGIGIGWAMKSLYDLLVYFLDIENEHKDTR